MVSEESLQNLASKIPTKISPSNLVYRNLFRRMSYRDDTEYEDQKYHYTLSDFSLELNWEGKHAKVPLDILWPVFESQLEILLGCSRSSGKKKAFGILEEISFIEYSPMQYKTEINQLSEEFSGGPVLCFEEGYRDFKIELVNGSSWPGTKPLNMGFGCDRSGVFNTQSYCRWKKLWDQNKIIYPTENFKTNLKTLINDYKKVNLRAFRVLWPKPRNIDYSGSDSDHPRDSGFM